MPNADTQALQATALAGATELIQEGLKPRTIRVRPPAFAVRFSNGQWSIVDEFVIGPSGPGPSERTAHLSATELIIFADERTVDGILNRLPSPTMSAARAEPRQRMRDMTDDERSAMMISATAVATLNEAQRELATLKGLATARNSDVIGQQIERLIDIEKTIRDLAR